MGVSFSKRGDVGAIQIGRAVPSTIVYEDGTLERWQQPKLPAWEVPKRDPHERRPRAPAAAQIAELAAASDEVAGDDISSLAASAE